jgi:tetratricopeptide (TPR) repeat protein/O-antigen ligase
MQFVTLFLLVLWLLGNIHQGRFPLPGNALSWSLVVLSGYLIVSSAFSVYPHRSWLELANVLSYVVVFILLVDYIESPSQVRVMLWILAILGSGLTLFGFGMVFLGIPAIFHLVPVHHLGHLGATFPNYNHFAAYLGMIIPLTMSLLWMERSAVRPFILLLILIMTTGIFFTLSRGGITSFVLGMMLYVILLRRAGIGKRSWWMAVGFIVMVLMASGWLVLEPFVERWVQSGSSTMAGRMTLWESALAAFQHRPIFGFGLGTFRTVLPAFALSKEASLQRHALNDYLEWLSEIGMVGVVMLLVVVGLIIHLVIKALKINPTPERSAIALGSAVGVFITLVNAVVNFPLHIPALAITLVLCLAIPVGLASSEGTFRYITIPCNSRLKLEIGCAMVLACVFVVIQLVRPYMAERKMDAIHHAQKIDDPGLMLRLTKKAIKWDPRNAEIQDLLGSSYRSKASAEGLFARNESKLLGSFYESTEVRDWRRIPNEPRQVQALFSFEKAIELCPYDASFMRHRGEVLLEMGKNAKALSAFRHADSLNKFDIRSGLLSAQAMVAMGDTASAMDEYRKLLSHMEVNELQILEHAVRTLDSVELVLSLMGGDMSGQLQVAKALERSGRWGASWAIYDYLFSESGDSAVLTTYVNSLNRHGEFDQSVKVLEKHLVTYPDDWDSREKLAKACQRCGRWDEAGKAYQRLWGRFPDKLQYGNSLGNILLRAWKDSAAVVFEDIYRMQPDNIDALMGIGKCLEYGKDYINAITTYQRVLALQPNHFEARLHLSYSYNRQGMLTQAVEQAKRCLELQPENTQVQGYLGVLYYELGLQKEVPR